jgi:hypothetical protein
MIRGTRTTWINRRVGVRAVDPDPQVHLPGLGATDTQTLCGHSWPDDGIEETEDVADCKSCLAALAEAMSIARCRRLRA